MSVTLWNQDGLCVMVEWVESGDLRISGHHLRAHNEYEYVVTIDLADVPVVVAALNGNADAPRSEILELLQANAAMILRTGELTWLKNLGLAPAFWSH